MDRYQRLSALLETATKSAQEYDAAVEAHMLAAGASLEDIKDVFSAAYIDAKAAVTASHHPYVGDLHALYGHLEQHFANITYIPNKEQQTFLMAVLDNRSPDELIAYWRELPDVSVILSVLRITMLWRRFNLCEPRDTIDEIFQSVGSRVNIGN